MDPKTYCWKCKKSVSEIPGSSKTHRFWGGVPGSSKTHRLWGDVKIGFRAACPHCSSDLHVCVNCRYFAPGKPNDCLVPGTEPVRDREAANFCEEFKLLIPSASPAQADKKKNFESLFKDEG
jgi:hypothetical protein